MANHDETDAHGPRLIPQGRLRRTVPVARLTARTAGEAVVAAMRSRVTGADKTEFRVRTAERYAELLGRSKGALMKAGQLLSFVSMGSAVPPELEAAFQNALGKLRADAPPMAAELARAVLEEELGDQVEAFAEFDWDPLASASIGQVHAAQLQDGRRVAVKIQYPGVADAIRADLQNVELMATFVKLLLGIAPMRLRLDPRAVAKEIEAKILEEVDYRREAANQREFAAVYRGHPFIRIPAVLDELSTGRVLTQELAEGRGWDAAVTAEQHLRDAWGEALERFSYGSVNHFRLTNTDPHPGNYLFADDGGVTFLDFGCVTHVPSHMGDALTALMRACLGGDIDGTWRAALSVGLWEAGDPVTPEEVFTYWHSGLERYWGEQPFTVTPERVARWNERQWMPTGPSTNAFRHIRVPKDWTMMGRMDSSVTAVLGGLRATGQWGAIAAEFFEGAPPVTPMGELHHAWLADHPTAITYA